MKLLNNFKNKGVKIFLLKLQSEFQDLIEKFKAALKI